MTFTVFRLDSDKPKYSTPYSTEYILLLEWKWEEVANQLLEDQKRVTLEKYQSIPLKEKAKLQKLGNIALLREEEEPLQNETTKHFFREM